jgi:hypothetical protein
MYIKHILFSSKDIKELFYIAENQHINLLIAYDNDLNEYYITAICRKCKNIITDNNVGRLKFNLKVHFSIRHGVDL